MRAHDPDTDGNARVRLHLGDSSTLLAVFSDGHFAWIYIDGDHSELGVKRDADCAARKIGTDGLLVFNDYMLWSPMEMTDYGVLPVTNRMLVSGD